nr:MAG TPA: hypothetical protein [Caudoviricetes sp.]DAX44062.1 MAG TPA: hypothetical protein [Caudoviricetes sp.]
MNKSHTALMFNESYMVRIYITRESLALDQYKFVHNTRILNVTPQK